MAERATDPLGIYLNDHLAGATVGADHARQLAEMHRGDAFAGEMSRIAEEIEEDRATLLGLMEELGVRRNPVKVAGAWVTEKAGRLKFTGRTSGHRELGRYLALETLALGVAGKRSLWTALEPLAEGSPVLARTDWGRLIARADGQRAALEQQRLRVAGRALSD